MEPLRYGLLTGNLVVQKKTNKKTLPGRIAQEFGAEGPMIPRRDARPQRALP